jgi:hypothetical protein
MKVGDLVRVNHYGKKHGPVGLIISRALSLPSEWWIVEWMGIDERFFPRGRETIRSEHLKVVSS